MTRPKPTSTIGPDVDLKTEDVRLPDGSRLTDAKADELAEWALARHLGRPSVSGGGEHTPSLTVRVTRPTREALEAIASSQGRRLADVSRDALAEYIRRHAS
ncbi:MAG: ribbon-helix-helix protein, CopG family [Acidimicrobiales bacterium]